MMHAIPPQRGTLMLGLLASLLRIHTNAESATASKDECDLSEVGCTLPLEQDGGPQLHQNKCSLYLAKSTIPNAGLGMFTGVSLEEHDTVGFGDPAIPIVDVDFHNDGDKSEEDYHWILTEYDWRPHEVGPYMEAEGEVVNAFSAGMGAAPNCHFRLKNVFETNCEYDTAGVTRADPGIGAFTGYHSRLSRALDALAPGQELFVDYGQQWFLAREDYMGLIPLQDDYPKAQAFIDKPKIKNLLTSEKLEGATTDLWNMIQDFPYNSRPLSALPKTFPYVKRAMEVGIEQAEKEQSILPIKYLEKHGKCLDNIRFDNSAIPHAGRGAFATRFLPKGSTVSIAPLLHIPDRDSLNMYSETYDIGRKQNVRDLTKQIGKQLLLNYCFGHKSSTLLLCPYGSGTWYINHNSKSPNTKIVWSEDPTFHNSSWLLNNVDFFEGDVWSGGMSFEFVALRDIIQGEEVTIDYGQEWEDAWKEHVEKWVAPERAEDFIFPHELNKDEVSPLKTHEEDPTMYGEDVDVWCTIKLAAALQNGGNWRAIEGKVTMKNANEYLVRRILQRTKVEGDHESFVYTLEVIKPLTNKNEKIYTVKNVPRSALSFYYKPYRSDAFVENAFRHELMVPDEIFPKAWKNIDI